MAGKANEKERSNFSTWRHLLAKADERLRYDGRTRRPPRDRVSALLGFGYALLLTDVTTALHTVGLETGAGLLSSTTCDNHPCSSTRIRCISSRNTLLTVGSTRPS